MSHYFKTLKRIYHTRAYGILVVPNLTLEVPEKQFVKTMPLLRGAIDA